MVETRHIRALLLADSHLGFDHPVRPKVRRRRRGHDFLANHRRALQTAIDEGVDLVVHGGDLFHKPSVPASLVHQAFEPLKRVAGAGSPVFLVPGNHERSRIPFDWLASHPGVHVFKDAGTVSVKVAGTTVAVSGIPCIRRDARTRFPDALARTGWAAEETDLRLLVLHQAFEGATVGPSDFTFRRGHDVVKLSDVPDGFAAVLAGHIHRSQVLETDLRGRPCPVPVFYPGSVERTAFAERDEVKGFMTLEMTPCSAGGSVRRWTFRDLHARPMEIRPLRVRGLDPDALERGLRAAVASVPPDTVLRLEADGPPVPGAQQVLAAERLRRIAPESMNVDVVVPGLRQWNGRPRAATQSKDAGRLTHAGRSTDARTSRRSPSGSDGPVQGSLF
jgi:DNA repair exonuclease SbcCD nuclease subunit